MRVSVSVYRGVLAWWYYTRVRLVPAGDDGVLLAMRPGSVDNEVQMTMEQVKQGQWV